MRVLFIIFFISICSFCNTKKTTSEKQSLLIPILQNANLSNPNSQVNNDNSECPPARLPENIFLADTVVSAPAARDADFRRSSKAVNGICGGGETSGSTDVFTLDTSGEGASIILAWNNKKVLNTKGTDFIVFENPFKYGDENTYFMEPLLVEVSRDMIHWCGFLPAYAGKDGNQESYNTDRSAWTNFAGIQPVFYNMGTNNLSLEDLFIPSKSGGDHFDLDDLYSGNNSAIGQDCTLLEVKTIQEEGFLYIRLTSASARINPLTQKYFPSDQSAFGTGPDIDGVIARTLGTR